MSYQFDTLNLLNLYELINIFGCLIAGDNLSKLDNRRFNVCFYQCNVMFMLYEAFFNEPDIVSANANRCDDLVVVDRLSQLGR